MTTICNHTETELKLRAPPGAARSLGIHPLLRGAGRPKIKKLRSVYFDTPDFELCGSSVALRLRKDGARWVQAVKGGGGVKSGLHSRVELETVVAGPFPDCAAIASGAFSGLFSSPRLCTQLQPVFSTRFTRSSRIVTFKPGVRVEVCLDRGVIICGDRTEPVCEIELELKSGQARHLYEFGLRLLDSLPLRVENRSKAERGYALLTGAAIAPAKARAIALDAGMPVSAAFRAIVWASLEHLQANERGMLASPDPEYLHQMRVALRRMRSAFSTFSGVLEKAAADRFVAEMKWLARELGPARDWDVFMNETLPPMLVAFDRHDALAALQKQGALAAAAARRRARRAVDSPRYQRLNLALAAWLADAACCMQPEEGVPAASEACAQAFADGALERRFDRVRKRGRKLRKLSAAELHLLRIAVKKLRYDVDSFAALYDEKCTARMLARLARLQNVLGIMNDAATVAGLMRRLGAKSGQDRIEARGIVMGWTQGRAGALKYELYSAWKAFRDCEKSW